MNKLTKEIKRYLRSEDTFYILDDNAFYLCFNGQLVCFTTEHCETLIAHGGAKIIEVSSLSEFVELFRDFQNGNTKGTN